MHFLPEQNFDCGSCTKCCRGWRIRVDAATAAKIQREDALEATERGLFARKTDSGACIFLDPQSLCSLHSQQGREHKPKGCRQFPFRLTRTPDGVYVGVSFYCSAVQANHGRPAEVHRPQLEELAADLPIVGAQPLPVHGSISLDWQGYRLLDDFLLRELAIQPPDLALGRALWAVCQISRGARSRRLAHFIEESQAALTPPAEPFILMEEHFFALLVARCEAPPGQRESFRRALLSRSPVTFERFGGWRGSLRDLKLLRPPSLEGWLRHYLKALVFRKFLITRRPLLDNLAVLYLVPSLLTFWTALSSRGRGSREIEEVDIHRALDECENRVITHPHDLDEVYAEVGQGFLDQVDQA